MPEQLIQIYESCPQGHRYARVTSKGFGWCKPCQRHSPATLEAEHALKVLRSAGKGFEIGDGRDRAIAERRA